MAKNKNNKAKDMENVKYEVAQEMGIPQNKEKKKKKRHIINTAIEKEGSKAFGFGVFFINVRLELNKTANS